MQRNRTQRNRLSQHTWQQLRRLDAALRGDLVQLILAAVESSPRWPRWSAELSFERFKRDVARLAGSEAPAELRQRGAADIALSIFRVETGLAVNTMPRIADSAAVREMAGAA